MCLPEINSSDTESVHLYQIWLFPKTKGIEPSYEQKRFEGEELTNRLRLVASPDGTDGSLTIHQDARIFLAKLNAKTQLNHELAEGRHAWLQVLKGCVMIDGVQLSTSDGAAVSDKSQFEIVAEQSAEVMLFDLA